MSYLRRSRQVLLFLAPITLLSMGLELQARRTTSPAAPMAVRSTYHAAPAPPPSAFVGVLAAPVVDIASPQAGVLFSLEVSPGRRVQKGELLARLEDATQRADHAAARAQLDGLEVDVKRALLEAQLAAERLERAEAIKQHLNVDELAAASYAAKLSRLSSDAANARRAQVAAQLEQAKTRLAQRALYAPMDGLVAESFFVPGALVQANSPLLRLVDLQAVRIRFAIPSGARCPQLGAAVVARAGALEFPGTVTTILPAIDLASMAYVAEAALDAPGRTLLPYGTLLHVSFEEAR